MRPGRVLAISLALLSAGASAAPPAAGGADPGPNSPNASETAPGAQPAPAGDANLYVMRIRSAPVLYPVGIKIDGRKVAALANGAYTAMRVEPGPHEVRLAWPGIALMRGAWRQVTIAAGDVAVLRVDGEMSTGRPALVTGISDYAFDSPALRDKTLAAIRKKLKFVPPSAR